MCLGVLMLGLSDLNADAPQGDIYLLAVGACPPYRHDIPLSVCTSAVDAIADGLKDALGISADRITKLTDASASGWSVLKAIDVLAKESGPNDRLIFYMNGHGGTFSEWAQFAYEPGDIREIDGTVDKPQDFILAFWTPEEPAIPALTVAENRWLSVGTLVEALEQFSGRIGLILDSCSSNKAFAQFHVLTDRSEKIDYFLASAGSHQVSSINFAHTMPIFTEALVNALDVPNTMTFGEAVEQ